MATIKNKRMKLVAHQVVFASDTKITFQDIIEQLKGKLPNNEDRLISARTQADASVIISKFLNHPSNIGIGAVFSFFHKDVEISTITVRGKDAEAEFNKQATAEGQEYLDQNIILFSIDDVLISCGIGGRANTLRNSIHQLAVESGVIPHTTLFNFIDMPRGDILESIKRKGVKHIEFDATFLIGSLPRQITSSLFNAIFGSTSQGEALKRRRENVAKLIIKSSSFFSKGGVEALQIEKNKWLDEVAEQVLDEANASSYTIFLNDNEPIRSGSLVSQTFVDVRADGTSFDVHDAHSKMVTFYHSIQSDRKK